MSNVITATFEAGSRYANAVPFLWQWDYGQQLQIEGLELPTACQVHFSNLEVCGFSVTAIATDGLVEIPNELLTSGQPVYAFVYLHTDDADGETEYRVTCYVNRRPQPVNPDPTPGQQDSIDQAIAALNSAVDQAEASAAEAAESAAEAAGVKDQLIARIDATDAALAAETTARENAVTAEADARTAADTALSDRIGEISEYAAKTEVTPGLDSVRYGITFRRVDADTVETFGTGNAARRVLWLNGQDAGMTTSSAFSQTLPAGKYKIEIEATGISSNLTIQYTYTTFATNYQLYIASAGRKTVEIEFSAPVMIGIGVASTVSAGTEENPGRIYFKATQLTAVDEVARAAIRPRDIKIACFGDSITWGRDGSSSSGAQVPTTIPDILADRLNAVCINYGVGSQGYVATGGGGNAYDNISSKDLSNVDVVMLAYGVNDGYSDLGAADSTDETTIMGQFNKILNYLYTQYPQLRVIVVAPWNGSNVGSAPDYWYGPRSHSAGYVSRKILSDTLKTRCDYYWIPYIEVYDSPINPFTIQAALPDGVHPSAAYYLQIGRWLAAKIGTIL